MICGRLGFFSGVVLGFIAKIDIERPKGGCTELCKVGRIRAKHQKYHYVLYVRMVRRCGDGFDFIVKFDGNIGAIRLTIYADRNVGSWGTPPLGERGPRKGLGCGELLNL
jgi:hypothetical protein